MQLVTVQDVLIDKQDGANADGSNLLAALQQNFLRNRAREESKYVWTMHTMDHNKQIDVSSCVEF